MTFFKRTFALAVAAVTVFSASAVRGGEPLDEAVATVRPANSTARCGGENCVAVARGLIAFVDRRLHGLQGNGRSCADCHMPSDNLQLSPADAEARFQFLQWRRIWNPNAVDPLFLPVDADDFRTNGTLANDFSNLRENGLVRVTLPLPANVRLIDPLTNAPSTETSVDVWTLAGSGSVTLTSPFSRRLLKSLASAPLVRKSSASIGRNSGSWARGFHVRTHCKN